MIFKSLKNLASDIRSGFKNIVTVYKGTRDLFMDYWRSYGGTGALLRSPYLHLAVFLLLPTFAIWSQPGWWDMVISVIPSMLGFTLGGFAIFLGFGDEKFKAFLAERETPQQPSLYLGLCASFFHFIFIEFIALVIALVAKGLWFNFPWPEPILMILPYLIYLGWGIGFGVFLYALSAALAAGAQIFRVARWYESHKNQKIDD